MRTAAEGEEGAVRADAAEEAHELDSGCLNASHGDDSDPGFADDSDSGLSRLSGGDSESESESGESDSESGDQLLSSV